MPFMKGPAPVRRTLQYLNNTKLFLKPYVRIFSLNYNHKGDNHKGAQDFVFWHLAHLQYKNPDVQVITFKDLTPTPFIRAFLTNGKEILMDIDRQTKDDIHERVLKTLCKTQEELDTEATEEKQNPAHFGYGCSRHCMCEIPGQITCPSIVPLPYTWRGIGGSDNVVTVNQDGGQTGSSSSSKKRSDITLDSGYIGHEVVVVKSGMRICGTGGALGSAPLIQTKSYFEVKLQQEGKWGLGLATRNSSLESGPLGIDLDSWILKNNGDLCHNGQTMGKLDPVPQEGDVVGVSYDHIELNFYTNGVKGNISFCNVRGTVYPALYVDEGAVLDVIFDGFSFPPPVGFDRIMKEKSIL